LLTDENPFYIEFAKEAFEDAKEAFEDAKDAKEAFEDFI
jgi:hypothetical protein